METRNFSYWRIGFKLFFAVLFLSSCRSTPSTPPREIPPLRNDGNSTTTQPLPPQPTRETAKKVAVILGPGGAKALAHVGVLRALQQKRIPIDKVVGLEWGSLVGGLFANKGQVHDLEWKLYKMQQKHLPHPNTHGFFAKSSNEDSVRVMDEFLGDSFQHDGVGEAKIPFECPARSVWTGVVAWQNRGLLKDAVKRCLPFPPMFKAQGTFLADPSAVSETIERLRGQGFNVILLVNVLGTALPVGQDSLLDNLNHVILWQEIKRSVLAAEKLNVDVIHVDTSTYPMLQFDAGKELATLGETAGNAAADALISKYGF